MSKSLKQEILDYVKSSKQVTLKDLYTKFDQTKDSTIRGRVNEATSANLLIRVSKGVYVYASNDLDAIVIHGNTLEELPKLVEADIKYDMVFLDIPYNLGGQKGGNRNLSNYSMIEPDVFGELLQHIVKTLKSNSSQLYFMIAGGKSSYAKALKYIAAFDNTDLKLAAKGSYTKLTSSGKVCNMGKYEMPPELIFVYSKSGSLLKFDNKLDFSLQRPPLPVSGGYPTEKPKELIKQIIEQSTYKGDLILDPFGGSGVVMEEALKLQRKVHTIDISENSINNFILPKLDKGLIYEQRTY